MMNRTNLLRISVSVILLSSVLLACSEDDDPNAGPDPNNPNGVVNDWIYTTLDEVYFWTDDLPSQGASNDELEPTEYFGSLLSTEDRFSRIYPNFDDLISTLERTILEAGYTYTLFTDPQDENNVLAVIRYTKRDGLEESPAQSAGLQRSDAIYAINGTTLTVDNYSTLIEEMNSNHTISYRRYSEAEGAYQDMGDISFTLKKIQENPNMLDTVYTIGNNNIAYYHYRFFSDGPESSTQFNEEMDVIFSGFKGEGVTDLILDLRYNNGGTISSAQNLASLIAPNVDGSDILYENVWNDFYMEYINTLENADDILRGKFIPKAENIGANLAGNTVYILVDFRSASASELIINALLPYMNVELIGTTTVGKNVGSIAIQDSENAENEYGMLPIVLKTFNSLGQSDYANGFTPAGADFIDETRFRWYPLGDVRDPLVSRAIEKITGTLPGSIPDEFGGQLNLRVLEYDASVEEGLPLIFDNPFN